MIETDKQLVPVRKGKIAGFSVLVVDARDLHTVLEVGKDFTNWIKHRINAYGFEEGKDFELRLPKRVSGNNQGVSEFDGVYAQTGENPGGRPQAIYTITLDMAKELAMIERNEMGRAVRKYFLDCERRSQQSAISFILTQGQVFDNAWLHEGAAASALTAVTTKPTERYKHICFILRSDGRIKVKSGSMIGVYIARESKFDREAVFLLTKAIGGYSEFRRFGCEILAQKTSMPSKYEFHGATLADIKAVFEPILGGRDRLVQKLESVDRSPKKQTVAQNLTSDAPPETEESNFTINGIDDKVGMLMVKKLLKHSKALVAISLAIEDENPLISGGAMAMLWGLFKRDLAQYYNENE